MVRYAGKSWIADDARHQPYVCLLSRVEPEHRGGPARPTLGEIRIPDAQHEALGVFVKLVLVDLTQAVPASNVAGADRRLSQGSLEASGGVAFAEFVEDIELFDQQTLSVGCDL